MIDEFSDPDGLPPDPEVMVTALVDDLVAALINTRIYWSDHPRVTDSCRAVLRHVKALCDESKSEAITISITTDFLVYEDRPLLGATMGAKRFIETLRVWGSGGISLTRDATNLDLELLLKALNEKREIGETFETINTKVRRDGPSRVALLPEYNKTGGEGEIFYSEEDAERMQCFVPMHMYQSVMDLLQGITVSVATGGRIDFDPVMEHAEDMLQRLEMNAGPMINLARQDQYDAFTFGHSMRVSVLALNFGRALTNDKDTLIRLGTAALLHDVGKAMVPFEVLHSSKPLTDEEREEICRHPEYGAQILIDHDNPDPHAISATFGHHCSRGERGYPRTIHEHNVSLVTDIVGVVDVYEALTAARPYKRPMSPIRAYRIMMGMQDKFDPAMLRRFIEVTGIYPCGQLVEMNSGALARVETQTGDLLRPIVKLVSDPEGSPLESSADDSYVVDLRRQAVKDELAVVQMLREDTGSLVAARG
jgi:HD-GYP domain-containing protein (c-di-GMP phosphodiesterase class II)